ncbi:tRNA (N6-threonylcarbamoyladenosine(37)-N6)-methyltransferase TrmO [Desulfosporosinus nitroreducens]|uniref:tRNA (N6-threonylcarbamoyladenosine(37)-N6)-methyltransferase TrmO n=1 Tax=Desulfosporosinus nitroreducens TaxID=2018668 RepID=UPI00207C6C54|nr:tRNA (N6-threonylcarbamoyladenosine(37)-N6)-methyltransferase TrmO [Desulfosporosinus nitroreducens]MCO1602393.1 tRNA (N6-threonylcarbamoyladenosine(37)-N6)-methyltransferase TrmO [Desulfosporosinus nitroreducens]
MSIAFQSIGTIHTPYFSLNAPHQSIPNAPGDFWITLHPDYASALEGLRTFNYIYVIYHLNEATSPIELLTRSPWAPEIEIGLFASRSANRPNPLGLSIVQIKEIRNNELIISGIDAYNGTPLIDIKPYIHFLDSKEDANNGWLDALPERKHAMAHALGLSHNHQTVQDDNQHTHDHHDLLHRQTKHLHNHND